MDSQRTEVCRTGLALLRWDRGGQAGLGRVLILLQSM